MRHWPVEFSGKTYQVTQHDDDTFEMPAELAAICGRNVALKPAWEPIVLARKPLAGTVAQNVTRYGTGALNIDGCRIAADESTRRSNRAEMGYHGGNLATAYETGSDAGRWPPNVILDEAAAGVLDRQTGTLASGSWNGKRNRPKTDAVFGDFESRDEQPRVGDSGGPSRFFPVFKYTPKASSFERPEADGIRHPTVKSVDLMRWLVRLVNPPGGLVLDPFSGSGTTGEAAVLEHMRATLIEREPTYLPLIVARLSKPMALGFNFEEGA